MKHDKLKRIKRLLSGVTANWECVDPLSECLDDDISNTKITHKNAAAKVIINSDLVSFKGAILNLKHKWLVTVSVHFTDDFGLEYVKSTEIQSKQPLKFHELDDFVADSIEDIFQGANMKHYQTTKMMAEIL